MQKISVVCLKITKLFPFFSELCQILAFKNQTFWRFQSVIIINFSLREWTSGISRLINPQISESMQANTVLSITTTRATQLSCPAIFDCEPVHAILIIYSASVARASVPFIHFGRLPPVPDPQNHVLELIFTVFRCSEGKSDYIRGIFFEITNLGN